MACRVGITTNPARRKKEWEEEHSTLRNWRILHRDLTRKQAQQLETEEAKKFNCKSRQGGRYPESGSSWFVYKFDY